MALYIFCEIVPTTDMYCFAREFVHIKDDTEILGIKLTLA